MKIYLQLKFGKFAINWDEMKKEENKFCCKALKQFFSTLSIPSDYFVNDNGTIIIANLMNPLKIIALMYCPFCGEKIVTLLTRVDPSSTINQEYNRRYYKKNRKRILKYKKKHNKEQKRLRDEQQSSNR